MMTMLVTESLPIENVSERAGHKDLKLQPLNTPVSQHLEND